MNSKKKKILFMVGGTNVFGAEIVSLDVMKGFNSIYDIHCAISGWNDGDFKSRLEKEKIGYTEIKLGWYYLKNLKWSLDSLIHYPKAFFDYYKLLNNFNPDIIYVISYRNLVLLYPLLKKKIIYHVHDQNSNSKQHIFFLKLVDNKVLKYVAVSNFIKEDLVKCGIDVNKIEVIYNGIDNPNKIEIRNRPIEKITIGIVGQINRRKGHHILIKALNILKMKGYNFSLKIFGTGSEEYIKELKQTITEFKLDEDVEWKGYVSDKNKIYNGIDLAVCPAILPESFGLTAIEPAVYKIPVITSNIGAFPEIIKVGINGFMFKNEDYLDLYARLKHFFDNKSELENIGNSGYEYVKNNFNVEKMIDNIKKMIDNI
jgi:glycosyltransferase involved in cell wall biosynthesis